MDINKIVAAIYAVNAEPARMNNAAAFLLRYDEMLVALNAREDARRIAMKDVVLPAPAVES